MFALLATVLITHIHVYREDLIINLKAKCKVIFNSARICKFAFANNDVRVFVETARETKATALGMLMTGTILNLSIRYELIFTCFVFLFLALCHTFNVLSVEQFFNQGASTVNCCYGKLIIHLAHMGYQLLTYSVGPMFFFATNHKMRREVFNEFGIDQLVCHFKKKRVSPLAM